MSGACNRVAKVPYSSNWAGTRLISEPSPLDGFYPRRKSIEEEGNGEQNATEMLIVSLRSTLDKMSRDFDRVELLAAALAAIAGRFPTTNRTFHHLQPRGIARSRVHAAD